MNKHGAVLFHQDNIIFANKICVQYFEIQETETMRYNK